MVKLQVKIGRWVEICITQNLFCFAKSFKKKVTKNKRSRGHPRLRKVKTRV